MPAEERPLSDAVVVVTPYSSGCCIAKEIQDRGYQLICLWSAEFSEAMKTHVPKSADGLKWNLELDEQKNLDETANLVRREAAKNGMEIVACVCGGEAGVDLADALSEHMGLLSNGTAVANRRDKKVQQELIKEKGLRSVRQVAGREYSSEVDAFLEQEAYPVIVKPLDSAGSDGVVLCHTKEEAKAHFLYLINDHEMVNGGSCDEALCQEFLRGKEYVVDQVSRDGVHKTVMVWVYDKRNANGASFVYFGDIPVDSESTEAKKVIPYARAVLDALGCANGPSHAEVIITENGEPCLVEMNCRAHGGDGIWQPLCRALTGGYNQIDASVDAYLSKEKFDLLPDKPVSPFKAAGQCVDLVSYKEGVVHSTDGYDLIRSLPSFVVMETHVKVGAQVSKTVDIATEAGSLVIMNQCPEALDRDLSIIRHLQQSGQLFRLESEEQASTTGRPRSGSLGTSPHGLASATSAMRHRRLLSNDTPETFLASMHI